MNYYEKLKEAREEKGLTQKKVAEQLQTTPQQIGKYERGEQKMTIERLKEFCELYQISADYILDLRPRLDWTKKERKNLT